VEIKLHAFALELDGGEHSSHFTPWEVTPGIHWIGGEHKIQFAHDGEGRNSTPVGNQTPAIQTILKSLYW